MQTGYNKLCDWWSLGVIMYEMLIGVLKTAIQESFKGSKIRGSIGVPESDPLHSGGTSILSVYLK